MDQAHGTNDGHIELAHHQFGWHGTEGSLKSDVHQESLQDVIHVMPQSNLVAPPLLRHGKEGLATVPRTEEARRLTVIGRRVKRGFVHLERHIQSLAKGTQIFYVGLIRNVGHAHMHGPHLEMGTMNAGTSSQQLQQCQGVFASRKAYQNDIAVIYQPIVHHPLTEMLGDAAHEQFFFCKLCHISVKRAQNYMKNHILSNIYL